MSQLGLFEISLVHDHEKSKLLAQEGMDKAVAHAEAEIPDWFDSAMKLFVAFLRRYKDPFMGEDVREWCLLKGLPKPPSPNAWGALIRHARSQGLIVHHGYGLPRGTKSHGSVKHKWIVA